VITLDADFVIAHLTPDDVHHEQASEYLRESADETLVMHPLNLAEVLVGGVRAGRGEEMFADLQAIGVRTPERSEGEPLRLAKLRAASGLKLPDCCALDTALVTGAMLATFDGALATAARQRGLAVLPD
jgi:predicted nucleic acid-binding protein